MIFKTGLGALLLSTLCACSSGTVHVYNGTPQPVEVVIDGVTKSVAAGEHTTFTTKLEAGRPIVATQGGRALESVEMPEVEEDHLFYNVRGAADLVFVDYSDLYVCDDGRDPPQPGLKILERLKGRTLYAPPRGHVLDRLESFPEKTAGCTLPVMRMETAPPRSMRGVRTETQYYMGWVEAELRGRGILTSPTVRF